MILQGPPGSGKTTAILELIYQLCKRGKRVLLCASTHVAVDNVLEKIVTHPQSEELLSVINPVRIGKDDAVASDYVKPFVHSNVKSGVNAEYEEILNDSFNLVCGTIVGVLQFPPIKSKVADIRDASIESMFDYLILDEASKTTFSEFLVPAILCKRWIIVGDVKQAIYRWRSGDWGILNNLRGKLEAFPVIEKSLTTNRRSEEEIIRFNNADILTGCLFKSKIH